MTVHMLALLQDMRKAKRSGFNFVSLVGVHKSTINAAIEHDWIFESEGPDGLKYTITGRGEEDLTLYESPKKEYHFDSICPTCRQRPIEVYSTGRRAGYCHQCKVERDQRRYATTQQRVKSELCPKCKQRPRMKYKNGRKYHAYCKECRRADRIVERKLRHKRDLERVQAGEFLPCRRCKKCPRWVTGTTVQDYCYDCAQIYKRERMFQKILNPAKSPVIKTDDMCRRKGCFKPRRVSKKGFVYPYCFMHSRQTKHQAYEQSKERQP